MAEPFLGQIALFGFNFAPLNWALCQGQILPISQNSALFSLLGTQYGGNGTSNFALPNFQGNVVIGQGLSVFGTIYDMGETGGTTAVALTSSTMPAHAHNLMAATAESTANAPAGAVLASPVGSGTPRERPVGNIYNQTNPDTALQSGSVMPAGQGLPHNNLQPLLVLNYCIALSGTFPTRP